MADDDAEQRIQRAMERLFSTSPIQTASSSSPPMRARDVGSLSPFLLGNSPDTTPPVAPSTSAPSCRPWDRDDLFKRLATFKSISWFGKPSIAGPVACARRGWVNVDLDMVACEVCEKRLNFPIPAHWPKQTVEEAALDFSLKLDAGHKPFCPWKGVACAEELATFAHTSATELTQGYEERFQALSFISGLPVLSVPAIEYLKETRAAEVNYLLALSSEDLRTQKLEAAQGEAIQKLREKYESFCQAQKVISLCGWEAQVLPYAVDNHKTEDCGPKVSFAVDKTKEVTGSDPARVVLVCKQCHANVGLWHFDTMNRSSLSLSAILATIEASATKKIESSISVPEAENRDETPTTNELKVTPETKHELVCTEPSKPVGLDLSLTIAGGPRPTRLSYPPGMLPASIPIPVLLSQHDCESRKSTGEREPTGTREARCSEVGSNKMKRKVDDQESGQRKKFKAPGKGARLDAQGIPGCSSVNAVEMSYQNKHENSAESVECSPHESDEQETVLSRENNGKEGQTEEEGISNAQPAPHSAAKESPFLSGGSSKEFDPIRQHRYFCPWVNAEAAPCGWQLTVDALYSASSQRLPYAGGGGSGSNFESERSAVTRPVDVLASVRKMLGGKTVSASVPLNRATPT